MYPSWHILSPKSALRLSLIITGLLCAFPTVSEAARAGGGTTTTMVLSYAYSPPRWIARCDPLNVRGFQLDVMFDPARAHLDQTVGMKGIIYKFPFMQTTPPNFGELGFGLLQDVAGGTSTTSPGDVDIFELQFIDLHPELPIDAVPFTVFASSNDFIVGFDPVTMMTVIFGFGQIAPTTRTVPTGVEPHIWDPDTLYDNGTTGGAGTWDTSSNSWDDVPGPQPPPPPASDTPWDNATHANDIAVFGGNPGSGIVTVAVPISAGGFQFDNSGYNIQGNFIGLSAPPGRTPIIDTGANNAMISSTIVGNGFTKVGTGTLALTGANNYTGATTVNAGTLLVNNTAGSGTGNSAVMVNSGGVLGGTGAIAGPVNVNSSAAVLGGNGATASGALTIASSLNLNPGSIIELALGAAGAHSTLNRAAGNWTFAPNQAFTFINVGAQPGFYDNIITGLAADPGGVASWMITSPGFAGTFFYDGAGHIDLNITAAPPVLQLTTAVSRKTHGAAGTFDVPLPPSSPFGVECRSGGGSGDHSLVFTFTNPVVSGSANVATMGTGSVSGSPVFAGNTMTVDLTNVTDVQLITVTLSGVTDSFAQVLPDTAVTAKILLGDTNGNSSVNAGDVAQTKAQSGNVTGAGNFRNDTNVTGSINAGDVGQVKANSGHSLP